MVNRRVIHYQSYIFRTIAYNTFQNVNTSPMNLINTSEFIVPYFRPVTLTPLFNIEPIKLIDSLIIRFDRLDGNPLLLHE